MELSWLERLRDEQVKEATRSTDPWRPSLERRLRGKVGADGIERVSTQAVFDFLKIPQERRGAGAGRRLAKLMPELGWSPMRTRGLTRGGYRSSIRGYCRDARPERCRNDA